MNNKSLFFPLIAFIIVSLYCYACKNAVNKPPQHDITASPEEIEEKIPDVLRKTLQFAASANGNIGDSVFLFNTYLTGLQYEKNEYSTIWSEEESWKPLADSLFFFISNAKWYGLFPEDLHYLQLHNIRQKFLNDTTGNSDKRNVVLWSQADIMLTDAFMHIVKDIKWGRLPNDSTSFRKDSALRNEFYQQQFDALIQDESLTPLFQSLEPSHKEYHLLKAGIPKFLDSADNRIFTFVPSPKKDSLAFVRALQKRLFEGGFIINDSIKADSLQLAIAVKKFQQQKKIAVDGKAGESTIRMLNTNDKERFTRLAITLDKYKLLPARMPERYIWVNLPSFAMKLQHKDSAVLYSKIICGKNITRTPLLNSAISEIITYPQWTVPNSIIVKEILPAVKRNPGYLARKGFSLINKDGEEVNPYTVDWSKYTKGIPYKVVQGSGDANALGVLKFNFPNKYAVYLHDTNQRYLFGQAIRSLSHGCVRVQEWKKLADYIIRYDSPGVIATGRDTSKLELIDSLNSWLAKKEKHSIPLKNRLPVYIRYFSCEGKNGGIIFYDDIYGEDKRLREKYFAGK